MKNLKKGKLRRIDRLGDRLQEQFQELLAPFFATKDEIIRLTENPDYVLKDKILRTRFNKTINTELKPGHALAWECPKNDPEKRKSDIFYLF